MAQQQSVVVLAPNDLPATRTGSLIKVFLAGSIEQGKARDWQSEVQSQLKDLPVAFFNPRRAHWDPSWGQSSDNPQLVEQIQWELKHLESVDFIAMYIEPGTLSPISVFELGLHMRDPRLMVACPPGFWREANVHVTCKWYGKHVYPDLETLVQALRGAVRAKVEARPRLEEKTPSNRPGR